MIRQTLVGAAAGIVLSAAVAATVSWAQQPPRPNTPQAPSANQPVQGVSDAAVLNQKIAELTQKFAALEKDHNALKARFENHHHVLENYGLKAIKPEGEAKYIWVPYIESATGALGDAWAVNGPIIANKGAPTGKPKP
jgi:hypothetical protein